MERHDHSIGFPGLLQLVLITLRLCGVIDWNWILVLLPAILCVTAVIIVLWANSRGR